MTFAESLLTWRRVIRASQRKESDTQKAPHSVAEVSGDPARGVLLFSTYLTLMPAVVGRDGPLLRPIAHVLWFPPKPWAFSARLHTQKSPALMFP